MSLLEVPEAGPARTRSDHWSALVGGVRVLFGEERLGELGALARELGAGRALLVTDAGLRAAGHADRALAALNEAGLETSVFDEVAENPTSRHAAAGAEFAARRRPDLLVGLGGGSVMDCAKAINFLLTNGGNMEDYWGRNRATRPMLPSIGVPTTAGTGSEAQSFALIGQEETHRKMACGDEKARFRAAILDPALTASAPPRVAAASGLVAVAHAVESFVSRAANPVSRMLARQAWELLATSLEPALRDGENAEARGRALLGAHLAGAAVEQSMLGAAHACANPLTARFGVPHGVAVAVMLPAVVRFNGAAAANLSGELAAASTGNRFIDDPAEELARRIEALRAAAAIPARLGALAVSQRALPELAREAAQEWTAGFNPRSVAEADLLRLYEAAY